MEELVTSELKGADLMSAVLKVQPELNKALVMVMDILEERKFRFVIQNVNSKSHLDALMKKLDVGDCEEFRAKVLRVKPNLSSLHRRTYCYRLKDRLLRYLGLS
jgi:hypothetical protein